MKKQKINLENISKTLQESVSKEEIKRKYVLQILLNFLDNKEYSKGKDFALIALKGKEENGEKISLFDCYHSMFVYAYFARNTGKSAFFKEVVLKVYNNIFLGRVSLIDSFSFLECLIVSKNHIDLDLTYNTLVGFIKKMASIFPSFSKERKEQEANTLFNDFISILVNLYNKYDILQQTIPPSFFSNEKSNLENQTVYKELILKAIQPCEKEIEQILKYNNYNLASFVISLEKESPEIERIILQKAKNKKAINDYYYRYIRTCKNGRFQELEKLIIQNPEELQEYVKLGLRQRAPELEPYIMKEPLICVNYATFSLGRKRIPELEQVIIQDPFATYLYAFGVIQGRFPKGEDTIAQEANASFYYAKDVIKGRFPKGEKVLLNHPVLSYKYNELLKKKKK